MKYDTREEIFKSLKEEHAILAKLLGPRARDSEMWDDIITCVMRMSVALMCPLTLKREEE